MSENVTKITNFYLKKWPLDPLVPGTAHICTIYYKYHLVIQSPMRNIINTGHFPRVSIFDKLSNVKWYILHLSMVSDYYQYRVYQVRDNDWGKRGRINTQFAQYSDHSSIVFANFFPSYIAYHKKKSSTAECAVSGFIFII